MMLRSEKLQRCQRCGDRFPYSSLGEVSCPRCGHVKDHCYFCGGHIIQRYARERKTSQQWECMDCGATWNHFVDYEQKMRKWLSERHVFEYKQLLDRCTRALKYGGPDGYEKASLIIWDSFQPLNTGWEESLEYFRYRICQGLGVRPEMLDPKTYG